MLTNMRDEVKQSLKEWYERFNANEETGDAEDGMELMKELFTLLQGEADSGYSTHWRLVGWAGTLFAQYSVWGGDPDGEATQHFHATMAATLK